MKRYTRRQHSMKGLVFGALSILILSFNVSAKIVGPKCLNVREVSNFWYHPMESSDSLLLVFNENQEVFLDSEVLKVQAINKWDDVEHLIPLQLDSAVLSSHMLYFQKAASSDRLSLIAEIEFDSPIIGFLADGFLFKQTNEWFAPFPTHMQPAKEKNIWSLEEASDWSSLDKVTMLSATRIRIEFTNHSATDPLRVITMKSGKINGQSVEDFIVK